MPMANADALSAAPSAFSTADRLEQAGFLALMGAGGALQFSIAIAQSLLAIAGLCWLALIVSRHERLEVPRFWWMLAALGVMTLVSAAFSPNPRASFVDTKQLVLFFVVPLTYRFATGRRADLMLLVIMSLGAASAAFGIVQYGIFHYDNLGQRARGTLGHYMTYSGLLMLVIGVALAQVLFSRRDRVWALLVMPALAAGVAVTFTRSALVGSCAAAAVLLALKDFRLMALFPIIAAVFIGIAPASVTARYASIFDLNDPTNRDRLAMVRTGEHMIKDRPLVGVGPTMVQTLYPQYRDADAVEAINPHLHNVPLQIAAERGLPALACWVVFVIVAVLDLVRGLRSARLPAALAAAALAAMVAMLTAGQFEYNFGDSEFLILLLMLITLPFAAARSASAPASA